MTKGFWLSIELLHDKNTTMQEKLLLIEINQLSMLDKGCIASNNHFAETFKVKKESISRSLSSLEQKGYITTEIKAGSRNHDRTITINKMLLQDEKAITNCLESKENKTSSSSNQLDYDDFFNLWNEFADKHKKSKLASLTNTRKKQLTARLKDYKNFLEMFKYSLIKAEKSNFLLTSKFFKLDWLIKNDNNIVKVIEGAYDNGKSQEVVM